jgi:hypothetical protein
MMEVRSYFADFLRNIRPTANQVDDYKRGHRTLRQRLEADDTLGPIIVSTFLQGSYRRATAIKAQGQKRADVDVIAVTKLHMSEYEPEAAMKIFIPFLDKHYKDKYRLQGRSIGIELSYVDLDFVITAAPSESEEGILKAASVTTEDTPEDVNDWRLVESWLPVENRAITGAFRLMEAAKKEPEWKLSPLHIPNREVKVWEETHPLRQIQWTWKKNRGTNTHYVNVVKAIKWWRRVKCATPKYPKGYPVEHLVGVCCPDGVESVADGVTRVLEEMASRYAVNAMIKTTPTIPDHGVPQHNVFGRVSGSDFAAFHAQVTDAAKIARAALDEPDLGKSVETWRSLFGDEFPAPPNGSKRAEANTGGYTAREEVSLVAGGRFA